MNRNVKSTVTIILIVLAISSGSAWYGFWKGFEHGGALETTAFAALSTAQIKRLKSGDGGDIENVISFFEYYVDHGLNQYNWYEESGSELWGSLLTDDYDESLVHAAKVAAVYRAKNPEDEMIETIDPLHYAKRKLAIEKLTK